MKYDTNYLSLTDINVSLEDIISKLIRYPRVSGYQLISSAKLGVLKASSLVHKHTRPTTSKEVKNSYLITVNGNENLVTSRLFTHVYNTLPNREHYIQFRIGDLLEGFNPTQVDLLTDQNFNLYPLIRVCKLNIFDSDSCDVELPGKCLSAKDGHLAFDKYKSKMKVR